MPSITTPVQNPSQQIRSLAPAPAAQPVPLPPYQYAGGDLGLNSDSGTEPWIYFYDRTGKKWLTHSVEAVLRVVDDFLEGRDRNQLLAAAAIHYGFRDVWTLIDGREAKPQRQDRASTGEDAHA